ncbi:hypothetical protein [Tunturiibacter gelidoferens]|uniref:Uncharacterized protein n=1 Tax=Tunturiibacter lichenicola TaxID=2051959 RepID=A0A7Y9NKU5_9BACT|nr:hypothetical protein [Edaphobacter lichenicola]NYF51204.1 hypothetical protein [Edaphobacter lichenicola]
MTNNISRRGFIALMTAGQSTLTHKKKPGKAIKITADAPPGPNFIPFTQRDWQGEASLVPVGPAVDPFAPLEDLNQGDVLKKRKETVRGIGLKTGRIDSGIRLPQVPNTDFRYHQVEQLLGQMASLLERGIATRAEWQGLGERSLATQLQLLEFSDLDDVHGDEVASGYYAFPLIQSLGDFIAQSDSDPDPSNRIIDKLASLATNGQGYPALPTDIPGTEAFLQATSTEGTQWGSWDRATAAVSKASYDNVDITYRRRRTEAARRINALKLQAFTDNGGIINFEERRTILQKRFKQDFETALARIPSIKLGIYMGTNSLWTMQTAFSIIPC